MLPPDLSAIAEDLQGDDQLLEAAELRQIALFEQLKKAPSFERFPGFTVLRHCRPGRVICEQGEPGATAFAILTSRDVLAIRQSQLDALKRLVAGEEVDHAEFERLDASLLRQLASEYEREIRDLELRCQQMEESEPDERRQLEQVAAAQLVVGLEPVMRPRGLKGWLRRIFGSKESRGAADGPAMIPVDGPSDIDASLKQAPLFEGELFGEMSCLNRSPRSATVVATRDCYLLEMVRNVLDTLHNDPQYKQKMDQVYRERVLEGHVRRLSLFAGLTDEEFAGLQPQIELVEFASGDVICEEGDESDCIYLIRSGVVKVVANAGTRLQESEINPRDWIDVYRDLAGEDEESPVVALWHESLGEDLRNELLQATEPDESLNRRLVEVLNDFIRTTGIPKSLGKSRLEIASLFEDVDFSDLLANLPESCQNWSELETRSCRRRLLELAFPGSVPRRDSSIGVRRNLAYLGRGESVGEMGVVLNEPRNATCVAYDHPDSGFHQRLPDSRTGAVPSRVELVRIPRGALTDLIGRSDKLRTAIDKIVADRQTDTQLQTRQLSLDPGSLKGQTPQFEQLGLIQGQKLMLVDLDRCTRCGSCVDACVAAHEDGNTRLYLDGPRYGNYLVPLTCRQCLDPVCMIGCPVGAINRGENGEIQIKNWCIGCRLCAEQCPYGSIQMNHLPTPVEPNEQQLAMLGEDSEIKKVHSRAVVCDMCSSLGDGGPSCVYACPHEAALRVRASDFFFDNLDQEGGVVTREVAS